MSSPTIEHDANHSLWMKWRLPGLIAVGILAVVFILYIARGALFPFIISIVLAELLYPFVEFVERWLPGRRRFPGVARVISILLIYIVFLAIIAVIMYLTLSSIISEGRQFIEAAPQLYEQARISAERWYAEFSDRVPPEVIAQIQELLESASGSLASAAKSIVVKAISGLVSTISFIIGLIVVPILLFYLLKDKDELLDGVYSPLSSNVERHTRNVLGIVHKVIGSYIRAQLISVSVVGVMVFVGLTLLGVEFALILGILAAVFAIIPIVGAIIGAVPGVLIALANDPDKVIWVVLVYVVAQLIESNIITPRLQANAVRIHPVMVMAILVIAADIAGLWGMIAGVPLTAAARDVFVYFQKQWSENRGQEIQPGEADAIDESGGADINSASPQADPGSAYSEDRT